MKEITLKHESTYRTMKFCLFSVACVNIYERKLILMAEIENTKIFSIEDTGVYYDYKFLTTTLKVGYINKTNKTDV